MRPMAGKPNQLGVLLSSQITRDMQSRPSAGIPSCCRVPNTLFQAIYQADILLQHHVRGPSARFVDLLRQGRAGFPCASDQAGTLYRTRRNSRSSNALASEGRA